MFDPAITTVDVKKVANLASDDLAAHIDNVETFMESAFSGYTVEAARYRLIGIYLIAHFAFVQEGQVKIDRVDVLSTTFNMTSDLALGSTVHGQQAMALDPTGVLATLNAQAKRSGNDGPSQASIELL